MTYLYSFAPFQDDYVISWPYKLKFEDWFLLNKLNIYKTLYLSKQYGDVIVYVTESHINEFEKILPENVILKKINLEKNNIWASNKFYSILNFINEFNEPFVHLDFDAFLLKDIFKYNNPDIVVAFKESHNDKRFGHENNFNLLKQQGLLDLTRLNCGYTYNCSIIGGKNLNFIKDWCYKSIAYSNKYNNILNYNITSILEQSHLTKLLQENNIKPMELINLDKDPDGFSLRNHEQKIFVHDKFFGAELLSNEEPSLLKLKWYESYNKITSKSERVFQKNQ